MARLRVQLQQPSIAIARNGAAPQARGGQDGVFATVDEAVNAAYEAQKKVAAMSLEERGRMIDIIRGICNERREELGRMELEETKVGRLDHKILKLQNMRYVLGVEAMRSDARSDSTGLCMIERAPWGVIGMILPVTHSVPTMVSNAINILAAGNTAVFGPHPSGQRVAQYALQLFNREIERAVRRGQRDHHHPRSHHRSCRPDLQSSPRRIALRHRRRSGCRRWPIKSGKRVIAGGPGNPPVVVDETADLDRAARCIIEGAAFDNNLLCIGEKEVFVVASVADAFIAAMRRAGAFQLDAAAIERLTQAAFTLEGWRRLRARAREEGPGRQGCGCPGRGRRRARSCRNGAALRRNRRESSLRRRRADDAVHSRGAREGRGCGHRRGRQGRARLPAHGHHSHPESGNCHAHGARHEHHAVHSERRPRPASLGVGGPGYFSHTIATPTGEGVTTPLTFTRERQMVVGNALRII